MHRHVTHEYSISVPTYPKAMETESAIHDSIKNTPHTADAATQSLISNFSKIQQNDIRTKLNLTEAQTLLKSAKELLQTLKDRKIELALDKGKPPTPSIFSKLKRLNIARKLHTYTAFFAKANTFFSNVNNQQITKTSSLTTMLTSAGQIQNFADMPDEDIKVIATNPCLKQIATLCNSRGVPDVEQVNGFELWECWKVNGEFSHELLRSVSSMCNGGGLPKKEAIEAFVSWDCWKVDGSFSLQLLRAVSSLNSCLGLPSKERVDAFFQWLPANESKNIFKLACRIFTHQGVPSVEELTEHEETLRHCLKQFHCATTQEGDACDEGNLLDSNIIKKLALFRSGPQKWLITIAELQQYLTAHRTPRNNRFAIRAALQSLLCILTAHGRKGIQFWIKKHSENPHHTELLTKALSISARLDFIKYALTKLPETQQTEYFELCTRLKPAPTLKQWDALKPLRQELRQRFKLTDSVRMMLEILWPQREDKRTKYMDKMDELFGTVPTLFQWWRLSRILEPREMQLLMDACIAYQAKPKAIPDADTQQRILEGMLLSRHYLPERINIPDQCFSIRLPTDDGKGVIINGNCEMSGKERLWHFISAMLFELKQIEYRFRNQKLTVMPFDGEQFVLEKPIFSHTDTSLVIKNWTLEQLNTFFQAIEFADQWYEKPKGGNDLWPIRLEARHTQMKARAKESAKTKGKAPLLRPPVILHIIKSRRSSLKPAVWSSLEHYASIGMLSRDLCSALKPIIQNDSNNVVSDLIKTAVTNKLEQVKAVRKHTAITMQKSTLTFKAAIEALNSFEILGNRELEVLEPYRKEMTCAQLNIVLQKIDYTDVSKHTLDVWFSTLISERQNPHWQNSAWSIDSGFCISDFSAYSDDLLNY